MAYFPVSRSVFTWARTLPVFALLLGLALLTGCKKPAVTDPNDPNFIVAAKGDWTVTRAQLNKQIDDALSAQGATREQVPAAQLPQIESEMLRFIVLKKILLDKAATLQLPNIDKEVNDAIDYAKNQNPNHTYTDAELGDMLKARGLTLDQWKQSLRETATMQAVLDAGASKDIEPSEQEVDAIYTSHKDAFSVPPMIHASRVLVLVDQEKDSPADKAAKKKAIDAARARVIKGEDFSKVAMEISEDRSSAPKGGDMGKFPRGQNEAGFDDVAFKTKVNTVSPVFLDSMGYQFVKVTDSSPAGTIPLPEARALITPRLRDAKKKQAENAYALDLLKNSGVTFYLQMIEPGAQAAANAGGAGPGPAPDQGGAPAEASSSSAPDTNLAPTNLSATNSAPAPSM
jgi:parvulin-like peptidyl-prolyl isomerase